jgi:hypothetical protein
MLRQGLQKTQQARRLNGRSGNTYARSGSLVALEALACFGQASATLLQPLPSPPARCSTRPWCAARAEHRLHGTWLPTALLTNTVATKAVRMVVSNCRADLRPHQGAPTDVSSGLLRTRKSLRRVLRYMWSPRAPAASPRRAIIHGDPLSSSNSQLIRDLERCRIDTFILQSRR